MKNFNICKNFQEKGVPFSGPENLSGSLKKYTDEYMNINAVGKEINFEVAEDIANEDVKL